jgi:hypothetical protein
MWINDISALMSFNDQTEKYMSYLCVVLVYENVIWVAYNQWISTNYFEVYAQLTDQGDTYQWSLLCNVNLRCKYIVVVLSIRSSQQSSSCIKAMNACWILHVYGVVHIVWTVWLNQFCRSYCPLYMDLLHCILRLS